MNIYGVVILWTLTGDNHGPYHPGNLAQLFELKNAGNFLCVKNCKCTSDVKEKQKEEVSQLDVSNIKQIFRAVKFGENLYQVSLIYDERKAFQVFLCRDHSELIKFMNQFVECPSSDKSSFIFSLPVSSFHGKSERNINLNIFQYVYVIHSSSLSGISRNPRLFIGCL